MHALFALAVMLLLAATCRAATPDNPADILVATDALGRSLPTSREAGPPRPNKTVGVFYFTWLGQHSKQIFDISEMLKANPADPQYGPMGAFHFWGKPLFDYYASDDAWVIRRHAAMLADAGIDVLIVDVTNAFTYENVYLKICEVFTQMRKEGARTPQIAFIANSKHVQTVQKLYDDFYSKGLHKDLWFIWKGKPLILTNPKDLPDTLTSFFTIRHSWAWSNPKAWFADGKDKWCWVDHHPQKPGWHESPDKPEQISVCVAQHPISNIGRSFHDKKQPDTFQTDTGLCFAEQFEHALKVDPEFIFITGWNEWVAQRFNNGSAKTMLGKPIKKGDTYFVDQYNQEYSRDIEPMTGGHGDNYYWQMISFIRRYKGVRPIPPIHRATVAIDGQFDKWTAIAPAFFDHIGDTSPRDHHAFDPKLQLTNTTGRNNITLSRVAYDNTNVYFYVQTKEPLSPSTDPNWMQLFINADANPKTGWLGYDLLIDHKGLRKNLGGQYKWSDPTPIPCKFAGHQLELSIPRNSVGRSFDFKWADNLPANPDWTSFYLTGDCAPDTRFNYRATLP